MIAVCLDINSVKYNLRCFGLSSHISMQNNPSPQLPCKGILKTSRSFDKSGSSFRKSAKFDELNVLQTFHPSDKDYGHMKIDEPKTPYNYTEDFDENRDQLDAELLVEKLRIAQQSSQSIEDETSEDDTPETEEERQRRREFELRRKAHYREFEAVKLARKLIEEEDDDDEDVDNDDNNKVTSSTSGGLLQKDDAQTSSQAASSNSNMEVEQILNVSRN